MLWIIQVVIALNFVSNALAGSYYTANKRIVITIYHYNDSYTYSVATNVRLIHIHKLCMHVTVTIICAYGRRVFL